ncbi:MAG: hypothetical protein KF845_06425 [Cyclobacteriaceae bacterium]|nr:hypothetical protein [Cyclobacteriaceae bacterium]
MRCVIGFVLIHLTFCSCGQTKGKNEIEGLLINPKIKEDVEKNIDDRELEEIQNGFQIYKNKVILELFRNDSLFFTTDDKPIEPLFKSFYLWKADTLNIDGAIGLFGGSGFSIKIVNNKATVYHLLSSDEFPMYAYQEKGDLIFRLDVPCHDTKIVLSELPGKETKQVIYGYVELKSDNYFESKGTVNGREIMPRTKLRANMKLYFRSGFLDLGE